MEQRGAHWAQPRPSEGTPLLLEKESIVSYAAGREELGGGAPAANGEIEECLPPAAITADGDSTTIHHLDPALVGSAKKTFFNIVITIIGSGVLGLPYTFMRSGWLMGSCAIIASALLSYYCMMLLVVCRQRLSVKGVYVSTYSAVGRHACGDMGERAVDALVLVSQGGCCVAYLIFISQNMHSIFCSPDVPSLSCVSGATFILMAAPLQILLSWVRSLTGLVPFSIVADVANLLAMGLVIRADLSNYQDLSNVTAFTGMVNVPFALGVACYCYEGFAMTLPLEASMKNRRRFPMVLALAMGAITVLYLTFGLVGYIVFKQDTKEIITLNLPNDWTAITVKLGLCLGLFLTFPVMMHPVHEIVEDNMRRTSLYEQYILPHPKVDDAVKKLVRTVVVLLTAFVAILVPTFAVFISLVGSSVCALLAFVLPGAFHFVLCWEESFSYDAIVARGADVSLVIFGIVFAVYGTYDTVSNL